MYLKRASCQTRGDLYDFYREWAEFSSDDVSRKVGQQMLALLGRLEAVAAEVSIWGLTSHGRLVLLAADDYQTPWYVTVVAVSWGGFVVRYRMPEADTPWASAEVEGEARDLDAAYHMVRIAMRRSGGWPSLLESV